MFNKAYEVHFNRFLNKTQNFLFRLSNCRATRQIWHVRSKGCRALLNDNCVLHVCILLQSGLFEDGGQCSSWYFNTWFPSDCDCARFNRVSKLTMTALHPHLLPTILFEVFEEVSDFHPNVVTRLQTQDYRQFYRKSVRIPRRVQTA